MFAQVSGRRDTVEEKIDRARGKVINYACSCNKCDYKGLADTKKKDGGTKRCKVELDNQRKENDAQAGYQFRFNFFRVIN